MKTLAFIINFFILTCTLQSQVIFRTVVPRQPVVAGESFPVQYVLEDAAVEDGFTPPDFKGLKIISGPDVYGGHTPGPDGPVALKNIVYTLVASKPGWLTIPGATAIRNNRTIKSNDVLIEVVSKQELQKRNELSAISEYYLKPGEDPYRKINDNLFIKASVDRQNCYIGQPVLATFKLYSRLESRSDIVKNPGFYGFTVHDILNLGDKHSITEMVNGKAFEVHTIRMVQLYPLQAGNFEIDPMEVMNKVEFSQTARKKHPEQKIVEGVFERRYTNDKPSAISYENTISTKPITIHVKPLPEKNKPPEFDGATGNFRIDASIDHPELAKNEKGMLVIRLSGQGNFVQLDAPTIDWPDGIEGFAPNVFDSLDKSLSPLKGTRTFNFPFVASKKGRFTIPPISFSFFNPDTNDYRTVQTNSIEINIQGEKEAAIAGTFGSKSTKGTGGLTWMLIALGLIIIAVASIRLLPGLLKMREKKTAPSVTRILSAQNP